MPHEPKRRHSTQRKGKRRASIVLKASHVISCPNCKASTSPHTVCRNCGYYRGTRILASKEKTKVTTTTATS